MTDVFRVSKQGTDLKYSSPTDLVVDTKYPHWKCDLKRNPRHYGFVDADVSLAAGQSVTIFSAEHGYRYAPSFLIIWTYPAGAGIQEQTYGMGLLEDFLPLASSFVTRINDTSLTIVGDNSINSDALSHVSVQFRFYIFAEDFPLYDYIIELDENTHSPRHL
jgi:hypothetical protein